MSYLVLVVLLSHYHANLTSRTINKLVNFGGTKSIENFARTKNVFKPKRNVTLQVHVDFH